MGLPSFVRLQLRSLQPTYDDASNPWKLLRNLTKQQWKFFLIGFSAWTWDAFDFYTVITALPSLSVEFERSQARITLFVTLVLMLRPLGAAIFGLVADALGRKRPFIINCVLLIVFQLATGFCQTYEQFLAVRALFGIAMGGLYGNAVTTALEDCDVRARGLMSGAYQSGYPFGFLLATAFWRAFSHTPHGWRTIFWFSAGFPVLLIIFRWMMPETDKYEQRRAIRHKGSNMRGSISDALRGSAEHWRLLTYLVLLMAGLFYLTHGTADAIPIMLSTQYNLPSHKITTIQVTAFIGAILGSWISGYCSEIFGRRFCMILLSVIGGALLYPYAFAPLPGVYALAFFEQFCVQGIFGIIPVYLMELSPPAYSTFIVGTSYHLGVLCASPALTIVTAIAGRYPLDPEGINYSMAICIFMACVYVYVIVIASIGPENRKPHLAEANMDESEEGDDQLRGGTYDISLWTGAHKGRPRY
ncbi:MFS transporter [Microthyrium microscopicum]|uniref:MFS transporter n=1 Tax=Microthyrium microscopicum TaxID=703497 RepID=A0A6A6UIT3_9PEZI|nr:MFS transporter [Microthyrium microscopicum]